MDLSLSTGLILLIARSNIVYSVHLVTLQSHLSDKIVFFQLNQLALLKGYPIDPIGCRIDCDIVLQFINRLIFNFMRATITAISKQRGPLPKGLNHKRLPKKIKINLYQTKYPVIADVCKELNLQISYESSGQEWDILWTDSTISKTFVGSMQAHQKINHFSGMNYLFRKANLTKNIQRMQKAYPQSYNFLPQTFVLPEDIFTLNKFQDYMTLKRQKPTFIIKPEIGCQGKGIYLWRQKIQIEAKREIIQVYIQRPLLYKGLKFDLRVYVLVTGCNPLRLYIFNEGLARFATEAYQRPDSRNISDLRMHLTNYAINRQSPKYVYNDSIDDLCKGHKKSLAEFFKTLQQMGLPASDYWSAVKDIAVKTLISGIPWLKRQYESAQPGNAEGNMCFQILGLDYLIEQNDKVYLLQVNHTPSLLADTPLDYLVKSHLVRDTLELVTNQTKIKRQQFQARLSNRSYTKEQNKSSDITFSVVKETASKEEQLQLNLVQEDRLGAFQRIYPCEDEQTQQNYMELIRYSLNSGQLERGRYRIETTKASPNVKRKNNSETKYIASSQQISYPPRDKRKISRIIKPDLIRQSRGVSHVFDRNNFRQEISQRNNQFKPRRNMKFQKVELQQEEEVNTAELNEIIRYQLSKSTDRKRRSKAEDREEVVYPYY